MKIGDRIRLTRKYRNQFAGYIVKRGDMAGMEAPDTAVYMGDTRDGKRIRIQRDGYATEERYARSMWRKIPCGR